MREDEIDAEMKRDKENEDRINQEIDANEERKELERKKRVKA